MQNAQVSRAVLCLQALGSRLPSSGAPSCPQGVSAPLRSLPPPHVLLPGCPHTIFPLHVSSLRTPVPLIRGPSRSRKMSSRCKLRWHHKDPISKKVTLTGTRVRT